MSYRRDDSSGYAGRLYVDLAAKFGTSTVFRDVDTLTPGADFARAIRSAVAEADVFLAIIGKDWLRATDHDGTRRIDLADDYVRLEVETALQDDGITVIPVLVGRATMPTARELPPSLAALATRNAIELDDGRWSYDAGRLVSAVEPLLGTRPAVDAPAVPQVNPDIEWLVEAWKSPKVRRACALASVVLVVWGIFAAITKDRPGETEDDALVGESAVATTVATTPTAREIGKEVWFVGFKLSLERATLRTVDGERLLDVALTAENQSLDSQNLSSVFSSNEAFLSSRGRNQHSSGSDLPVVPGKSTGKGILRFPVAANFSFDDAVITLGSAANTQAVVPLGSSGELAALAPRLLDVAGSVTAGSLRAELKAAQLRADVIFKSGSSSPIVKGHHNVELTLNVSSSDPNGDNFYEDALALRLPDGTTVQGDSCCNVISPGKPLDNVRVNFRVNDPVAGRYSIVLLLKGSSGANETGTLDFTI